MTLAHVRPACPSDLHRVDGPCRPTLTVTTLQRAARGSAEPNVSLAAGTYLVEDSDAATRSTNAQMGGVGQTIVRGFLEP